MERCPNLKDEVGGSNLSCEISSLLDMPGGHLSHVLWRWHVGLLSQFFFFFFKKDIFLTEGHFTHETESL